MKKDVLFTENGNITARIFDGKKYYTASTFSVTKVDSISPKSVSVSKQSSTTKTITAKASGVDNESGIAKYEFSKDNGTTWINNGLNDTYTFTNLQTGTYQVRVRITDKVGNYTISSPTNMATNSVMLPTYSVNPAGDVWAKSKEVTITYPEKQAGFIYQYSVNGGSSWIDVPDGSNASYTFNANGNIIARIYDGLNYFSASTLSVTKIDNTPPTCSSSGGSSAWTKGNRVINVTANDSQSGMKKIDYSYDKNTFYSDWNSQTPTSVTGTWSAERNNVVYIRATDNVGNSTYCPEQIVRIDKTPPTITRFQRVNGDGGYGTGWKFFIKIEFYDYASGLGARDVVWHTTSRHQANGNFGGQATAGDNIGTWGSSLRIEYFTVCDMVGNCVTTSGSW